MIECADLVEVRKKYFEDSSVYLIMRKVNPDKKKLKKDFLREIDVCFEI